MPELPEVETVRRGLEPLVLGRRIESVKVGVPRMVTPDSDVFCLTVSKQTIRCLRRRGKYLIFELDDCLMLSHLRMEGKYRLFSNSVPDDKHFHLFFELDNDLTLVYQDVRKFGTFELIAKTDESSFFLKKRIGPEPTRQDFHFQPFERALLSSRKKIKPHLLDQSLVAGLGNIYADEVLWAAKVHPETLSSHLTKNQMNRLYEEIIRIVALAVEKRGSTIRTYRNALGEDGTMQDFLMIYGRTGQPCRRCQALIQKIKVAGRGSHFCPRCQKW